MHGSWGGSAKRKYFIACRFALLTDSNIKSKPVVPIITDAAPYGTALLFVSAKRFNS
jgi:hypothetical protein